MAKSIILKKKKYSLNITKNLEKMHDFANLNQILGSETVYQLWGFFIFL